MIEERMCRRNVFQYGVKPSYKGVFCFFTVHFESFALIFISLADLVVFF